MPKDLSLERSQPAAGGALDLAWARLRAEAGRPATQEIGALFGAEADRTDRFSAALGDLFVDFSKQDLSAGALDALLGLMRAAKVPAWREAMFAGAAVNETEGRPALHAALRATERSGANLDDPEIAEAVKEQRLAAERFAAAVIDGRARGASGQGFTDIINIGIGGSDLGPALVASALGGPVQGRRVHFVSNVDGAAIGPLLRRLNPETTLVIVCSKTFSTLETRTNAESARDWLAAALGAREARRHFAAATATPEAAIEFGVDADRIFEFWDWVGGRFSLWSSVGLAAMIAIGPVAFREFLNGAAEMDAHFADAPPERNIPMLLGAIDVWHRAVRERASRAVAVYDERLALLPSYLQQLEMESNGKGVDRDGRPVQDSSAAVVWGGVGCDAQHAFFQLLHQGPDTIPVEFLVAKHGADRELSDHHRLLLANCFAQSRALMTGLSEDEAVEQLRSEGKSEGEARALAPHLVCPGGRPSTTILFDKLDPRTLGLLLAMAEHRVFVAGVLFGVNPFDQFGVELGKRIAKSVDARMQGEPGEALDPSTEQLIAQLR